MTPQILLKHIDEGQLWTDEELDSIPSDVSQVSVFKWFETDGLIS